MVQASLVPIVKHTVIGCLRISSETKWVNSPTFCQNPCVYFNRTVCTFAGVAEPAQATQVSPPARRIFG